MAAYYQPHANRQRIPRPTELDAPHQQQPSSHNPHHDSSAHNSQPSFLIFPAPAAGQTSGVQEEANNALPSPTGSSTSLQTSLLASVEARSSRPPNSTRSNSVERGNIYGEWEQLRDGPLPQPRWYRQPGPSSDGLAIIVPKRNRVLERSGSGWAWTLDGDDLNPGTHDLLGWQWTVAPSTSDSESGLEMETRYDDASSQLHPYSTPSDSGEHVISPSSGQTERVAALRGIPQDKGPLWRGRALPAHSHSLQPRRLSLKPSLPPSQTLRKLTPWPREAQQDSSRPSLPFGALIQALFAIDDSTMKLLNANDEYTSGSTLFGVSDGFPSGDGSTKSIAVLEAEHGELQKIRLLKTHPDPSPGSASGALTKGFRVISALSTNPFTFPVYLINLGWEYGWRGVMTWSSRVETNNTQG